MRILLWIAEYLYTIFYIFLNALGSIIKVKNSETGSPNLVLLPGFGARTTCLYVKKKKYEKLGYRVFLPDFGFLYEDIDKSAEKLSKYVEDIGEFYFVGYSMGGIIGVRAFQKFNFKPKKFITVGCPFHGAKRARFAPFIPSARQIKPGSDFLKKLRKGKTPLIFSIAAKYDELVYPESTRIKGCKPIVIDFVGHNLMGVSSKIASVVDKIVKS